MGRKRASNDGLPKYVYLRGGSYKLRYPVGQDANGRTKYRQESFSTLLECLTRRAQVTAAEGTPRTVSELIDSYLASDWYANLRTRTQHDYTTHLALIRQRFTDPKSRRSWPVAVVEPTHIYAIRTQRGRTSKVQANRLLSTLKVLFEYAREMGCRSDNPAKGVRRYKETPRDRYVTDAEFAQVFEIAPDAVRVAMTLAAITGMDQSTILRLRFEQFGDDGLTIERSKTGKRQVFEWSDMLRWCHDTARAMPPRVRGVVVCKRNGQQYTADGFRSIWDRLQRKAAEKGMERYTFHDLRAKAGSDSEDWRLLGHSSRALFERVYNRLPQKAKPTK